MPTWTGVDGAALSSAAPPATYGIGTGTDADCSLIEETPVIVTPAAFASASAFARASFIAAARACASGAVWSSTRKVIPSSVVAPAARAPSITSEIVSSRRTVAVTEFTIW